LAEPAPEPGRAADTAGAARGLGAIHPAKRYGLLATQQPATFSRCWQMRIMALQGSAIRALPGTCLVPASSTLHTPASGAADARRFGGNFPNTESAL